MDYSLNDLIDNANIKTSEEHLTYDCFDQYTGNQFYYKDTEQEFPG